VEQGIDALIVDRVLAVDKELRRSGDEIKEAAATALSSVEAATVM